MTSVNGIDDVLSTHEISALCGAHVDLGLETDELGAVFMSEEADPLVLRQELDAIAAVAESDVAIFCEKALAALDLPYGSEWDRWVERVQLRLADRGLLREGQPE